MDRRTETAPCQLNIGVRFDSILVPFGTETCTACNVPFLSDRLFSLG